MEHMYLAINVGGQTFHIRFASLRSIPRTLLTDLIDASLPLDLVFGGRAISEEDDSKPPGGKPIARDDGVKTAMNYGTTGISTNGAKVTPSHPYDRAKYVYLSCSNTFRPVRVSQGSGAPNPQATQTSPPRTSTLTLVHTPESSTGSAHLFVPATCVTSPRHSSVVLPTHKSRATVEGVTNKSFLDDDDNSCQAQTTNNVHTNVLNVGKTSRIPDGLVEVLLATPDLDPGSQPKESSAIGGQLEVEASSVVSLPQAAGADVYVDRNPLMFPFVLDLYRNGQLHLPPDVCSLTIRMELDFWKIPEELIGECCWREFQNGIDRMQVVSAISATLTDRFDDPEVRAQLSKAERVWLTMERPDYSKRAKIWCGVYYLCILLSTITFMLLTLSDFQEVKPEFRTRLKEYTDDNDTLHVVHYGTFQKPVDWLEGTEICLDIFFTLEFAVRLITCPDKKEFVKNKHNIIDILILSTAWTRCIYDRIITWDHENFTEARSFAMVVLNSMLGIRVLRMLHLAKIFRTLKVMYLSILASMQELALLVVVMGAGVLLFGSALFIAEGFSTPDTEPLQFQSIPEAMWWAIITMTTVGYGDYYPVHAAGYVVGAVCAVSGLLLVAMPIAIVASNFSIFYDNMSSRDQSLRRQAMLGQMIGIAMAAQGVTGRGTDKAGSVAPEVGSDKTGKRRHTSGGRKEQIGKTTNLSAVIEKPVSRSHKSLRENGHIKTSLKETSSRRNTSDNSDSRRERQAQRLSGAARPDRSSQRGREGRDDINLADDVKFHRSRNIDEDFSSVKLGDSTPITVGYVGVRTDGVAKDESEHSDSNAAPITVGYVGVRADGVRKDQSEPTSSSTVTEQHSPNTPGKPDSGRQSDVSERNTRRHRPRSGNSDSHISQVG